MAYFLAVDAGGTKTDYLLADDSRSLASVRTGSIKRLRVSESTAEQNLLQIDVTCIGAAGSNVPIVADWLRQAFRRHVGGRHLLLEDVEIALDAAFFGQSGILIMAGTGSNVAGRGPDGLMTAAGGWGPALADHGSGYCLGAAALRACFLALDEGNETSLLEQFISHWQLSGIPELVEKANGEPRPDFSQLAAIVGRCAEDGDAVAARVVHQEAAALAHLAHVVIERIRKQGSNSGWIPSIAFTGSILQHIPAMRERIDLLLKESVPGIQIIAGVVTPTRGALWRAKQSTQP